jgi:hypothetical protein
MKNLRLLAVAAAVAVSAPAFADQVVETEEGLATFSFFKPAYVRAEVGTTGYGGAIGYSVSRKIGVNIGYNEGELSYSGDIGNKDVDWDTDFDMKNGFVSVTYRPTGGSFGFDVGTYYQDNEIRGNATPKTGGVYRIDNSDFNAASVGQVSAKVTARNEIAPFLGMSYSPSITERIGLFGQVGVLWQGKPTATLTAANGNALATGGDGAGSKTVNQALAAEKANIEGDNQYEFLPVAKVGLQVRF